MPNLVLMRHGRSMWNANPSDPTKTWKYAGAVDIPLSEVGIMEALDAGKKLKNIPLDVVYCSMLIRAQTTALIALASHDSQQAPMVVRDTDDARERGMRVHKKKMHSDSHSEVIPMYCSNLLNERDFGDVQGMYSSEQKKHFSKEELQRWRCEWDVPFPNGESSEEVFQRTKKFYEKHILPQLKQGKNVLVVCHGFVIRVIIAYLEHLSTEKWHDEMIKELNKEKSILQVKNADPLIYSYFNNEKTNKDEYVRVSGALEGLLSINTKEQAVGKTRSKL